MEYNTKGEFLMAFKVLDEYARKLMLDGTHFKSYVIKFYNVYTITCIYLAALFDSQPALIKAFEYSNYILRITKNAVKNSE